MPWTIVRLGIVGSTQTVAKEHLATGQGAGIVIVAEGQTDGRGRRNRSWHSPDGGLYMTVLLKPVGEVRLIPLLGGVVVAEAIRATAGLGVGLKWPNDVLIGGKKVGGVLAESGWSNEEVRHVLLGMGVNLNNPVPDWLPDATSLSKELGEMVDIDAFLHRLLETLDLYLLRMESDPELILSSWRESSLTLGKMVCVTDRSGETVSGFAVDVDQDGSLIVDCGGEIKRVVSGVLEFR
jgi:BirA family biotin operon repressor/biotin-[acetyl-CoA-carboxylase] ligase